MGEWWDWANTPRYFKARILPYAQGTEPSVVLYIKEGVPWPEEIKGPRLGATLRCNMPGGYLLFSMGRLMTKEEIENDDY